jgi:hypothetical protein
MRRSRYCSTVAAVLAVRESATSASVMVKAPATREYNLRTLTRASRLLGKAKSRAARPFPQLSGRGASGSAGPSILCPETGRTYLLIAVAQADEQTGEGV